jgi:hypothetical protein
LTPSRNIEQIDEKNCTLFALSAAVKTLIAPLFVIALSFPAAVESAPISVLCPNSASTTDREFTLTTDPAGATCLDWGTQANELNANGSDVMVLAGWTVIDKDEMPDEVFAHDSWFSVTGLNGTSGSFTINSAAWGAFDQLAIGFVVGGGKLGPKWAVFELPVDETSGTWSNAPNKGGGLSHANLYGMTSREVTAVPEPATLLLLGSGLMVAVRRFRKQ